MSRSGGTYTAPVSGWKPAVEGAVVDSSDWNTLCDDIEAAVTETVYTGGLGATDNAFVRTDGTDTKKVQGASLTISDTGILSGVTTFKLSAYTEATLPAGTEGQIAYASDFSVNGGASEGSLMFFDGVEWVGVDTGTASGNLATLSGTVASMFTVSGTLAADELAILNGLSTAAQGAWSVYRRLRTAYTGNLIRVRRSSDNTEQDIGYTAGNLLDTSALLSFVGANNGFVTKLYDQSGYGYDFVQSTAASQPKIVSSGSLVTDINSKACIEFDGSDDVMATAAWLDTVINQGARAVLAIVRPTAGTDITNTTIYNGKAIAGGYAPAAGGFWAFGAIDQQAGTDQVMFYNYDGTQTGAAVNASELPYTAVIGERFNGTTLYGYFNGGTPGSVARGTRTGSSVLTDKVGLGKHYSGSSYYQGFFQEMIAFPSLPSLADFNTVGSNQASIAGSTWTTVT